MSRFRADSPDEREALFADALSAHRERASPFCTFELETAEDEEPAWIQFGDGTVNLDCSDEELDRLEGLLESFPAFTIEELNRPESAEGTNVRISAYADEERIAMLIERCFREVYGRREGYAVWATEV
ncbi:hypothetical protein [Halalkalicoccus ordinarius]|uniref:hypothetical protein n=1 Tax=Halalkalicoccus ordinarius TaxID=3116651 RepID=UPI00300F3862